MNNKKKTIGKRIERKFFHLFNDKSAMRRHAFCTVLAVAPAIGINHMLDTDASTQRGPEGQARYDMYQKEIQDMKVAVPSIMFTLQDKGGAAGKPSPEDLEKVKAIKETASTFSTRVIMDDQISEADIKKISYSYHTQLEKIIPLETMDRMAWKASFIEEARAAAASIPELKKSPPDQVASQISDLAAKKAGNEYWITLFAFMGSFELLNSFTKRALRNGRRRDDENIQEEQQEKFLAAKEDLENLLKPRSSYPPKT